MSKETAIILLGIWIVVVPQLGVPMPWRTVLLTVSGLLLIVIGLYLRAESRSRPGAVRRDQSFVENTVAADNAHEPTKGGINSLN